MYELCKRRNRACASSLAKTTFPEERLAMPIYQYAPNSGQCESCSGHFDAMQKMCEPVFAQCPACGQTVHRKVCAVAITGSSRIKPSEIEQAGFVQYRRAGKGVYEKTAGKGPDHIFP